MTPVSGSISIVVFNMDDDTLHELLDKAEALVDASPEKAMEMFEQIAMVEVATKAEEDIKCKEIATLQLGKILAKRNMANGKVIVELQKTCTL